MASEKNLTNPIKLISCISTTLLSALAFSVQCQLITRNPAQNTVTLTDREGRFAAEAKRFAYLKLAKMDVLNFLQGWPRQR